MIIFISLLTFWFTIVFIVTILDLLKILKPANRILLSFSLKQNFKNITLFTDNESKKSDQNDPGLLFDGIRGICHLIIVLFHYNSLFLLPDEGNDSVIELPQPFTYTLSFFGRLCFVIFFLINGVAAAKWFCNNFKSSKKISPAKLSARFYLERYVMFAPIYYIVLYFYTIYVRYLISDRFYQKIVEQNCINSMIPNMLFISNLICTDIMCMTWNWTISVLFQLSLIVPIFIYALKRDFRLGIFTAIMGNIFFMAINFYSFKSHGFTTEVMFDDVVIMKNPYSSMPIRNSYVDIIHMKPFIYGPAYVNGIFLGYLIDNNLWKSFTSNSMTKIAFKLTKIILICIAIISLGRHVIYDGLPLFSAFESSVFTTFVTIIFCVLFCEMAQNYHDSFLSSKLWTYLRRISRVSYLIHPIVFIIMVDQFPFNQANVLIYLYRLILSIFINFTLSLIITLSIEMPVNVFIKSYL